MTDKAEIDDGDRLAQAVNIIEMFGPLKASKAWSMLHEMIEERRNTIYQAFLFEGATPATLYSQEFMKGRAAGLREVAVMLDDALEQAHAMRNSLTPDEKESNEHDSRK